MEISVIIPVFNEADNIDVLYERLTAVLQDLTKEYELLFVNDGSKDTSLQKIKALSNQYSTVKYIDLSRNFGHQIAVSAGLDKSNGRAVVIIDADLQDPPELITEMYNKMKEGYEVVYARRTNRVGETALKKWTAKFFYRLIARITTIDIPLDTGDFRIIDHKVVKVLRQMPEKDKFIRGQISWIGFNQTFVEYSRAKRIEGETGYTYRKMVKFAIDGITAFSNLPLKIVTFFGMLVSCFAFFMTLYALYSRYILKDYVQGWTSLLISVLFIGGIQMIAIGIIGEYLSRMNNNLRDRPLYIIKDSNLDP